MTDFIFHDPSGRRARRTGFAIGLVLSLIAAAVAGFAATLAFAPQLPNLTMKDPRVLSGLHLDVKHLKGKPAWTRVPHRLHNASGDAAKPLTVAFYVNWDERSRTSLAAHAGQIDVLAPSWIQLSTAAGDLEVADDPLAEVVLARAAKKPSVLPMIQNAKDGTFDGQMADAMILNPAARQKLVQRMVALAKSHGYAGYVLDLEDLSPRAMAAYPSLLAQARAALKPTGRSVWVTAPFNDPGTPLQQLQASSDALILMAYDQHWGTGDAGPPAGQDWFEQNLDQTLSHLDESRTIVALGSYGYDWTQGAPKGQLADSLTFHEATGIAHDSGVDVRMDQGSLNPTFGYRDDSGKAHSVWFLDAPTLFNQIKVADDYRPLGYALWRLGSEDPGVWSVLPHLYGKAQPAALNYLPPAEDVDFDGTGEVLHVMSRPTPGRRSFDTDKDTGLISDEHYEVMPTAYIVQRYGSKPGVVALTFDDGPDPRWTPKILDILKAKHAPATFFVIGENMQKHPELVKREVSEGHVVGSHTYTHPNIGLTPVLDTEIELNATQRLFETITGKSMRLFRPPYTGDADPSTPAEIEPLINAQKLGYLIVGLRIDPDDWKKPDPKLIVVRSLYKLAHPGEVPGQVILLHDSGGDRRHTIEALPNLIDQLRAHGYQLVTVSQLAGLTPQQAMPPSGRSPWELTLDRIGFNFFRYLNMALTALFVSAIALGVGRLVFLSGLALTHHFTARKPPPADPETGPLVSVLIPCFNEEKVITASIARILESDWTRLEVIVLDDGSSDGTAAEVEKAYAGDPRVALMRFPNGGKANALNRGLKVARGDIVVALDADTLFPKETIRRLTRWFEDPAVGAVAGNAIVGNRINLVTRWQALEYVVAQNLERRALASLGAVTVVPGAVGAWRKAALEQLGGYPADTLAEDQDLTLAVQRAGWRVEFDPSARAYTEAPDTVRGLLKQRFRWSFGTLQCLWKHRPALFNPARPVLGFIALPQIWMFQIFLAIAAPLVDLAVIWSALAAVLDWKFHQSQWSADNLMQALFYWLTFVLVDLSACALGMALERKAPWRDLFWVPVQRFGYRQLMYYVVVKAVVTAVRGPRVGWGKLERRATAAMEAQA